MSLMVYPIVHFFLFFDITDCSVRMILDLTSRTGHAAPRLVMGGIKIFLYQLLNDKILRYHHILPCSDFYISINILLRNLHFMASYNKIFFE